MRANGEAAYSPVHWNSEAEPRHCTNSRTPDYQHAAIKYVVNRIYGRSRAPWIQENSTVLSNPKFSCELPMNP